MESPEIIKEYREFLKTLGYTKSTITGYSLDVQNYLKWLGKAKRKNVPGFIKYLEKHGYNPKTINHHIFALQHLREYLLKTGVSGKIPLNGLTQDLLLPFNESTEIDFLPEDIEKFISDIKKSGNKRYIALALILAKTGLKISEALNLKTENISGTKITVKNDEREIIRSVRVDKEVIEAINNYLSGRKGDSPYLFNSNKSDRLDRTVVNRFFKNYNVTPEQLRQYFIIRCLLEDIDKALISKRTGIKSLQWLLLRYEKLT